METEPEYSPPTALVSWAHKNADWDEKKSEEWISQILQFSNLLVENGVDADLDLWNDSDPQIDWTRWGPTKVNESDFVIIAISQAWKERWEGSNHPKIGAGAVAEADSLKGRFNTDQSEFQKRTILVLLPGITAADLPQDLHRLNRIDVSEISFEGIEDVLRALFIVPKYKRPQVGARPTFPKVLHDKATSPPDLEDVASKRAELDAEDGESPAVNAVHFERPVVPTMEDLTAADELARKLDAQVLERVFQSWNRDTELFTKLTEEPSRQLVIETLRLAIETGLISRLGPRIQILYTSFVAVFDLGDDEKGSELTLRLETESCEVLKVVPWSADQDEVEFLAALSALIFERPDFDGAVDFSPSSVFSGLSELLVLASEGRKGRSMGSRHAYRKLIQIVADFWIVSEDRIFPKNRPHYTIAMSRIDEMDWSAHIKAKQWGDEAGIDEALQIARTIAAKLQSS